MKLSVRHIRSLWFLALVILVSIGLWLYLSEIRPWLTSFTTAGASPAPPLAPADSYTYWYFATSVPLVSVPYNLVGPAIVISLLRGNFDLVVLFYVILFSWSLWELHRYCGVRALRFAVLLLANPLLMFQFFAANKEISIVIAMLLLVVRVRSGRTRHAIAAMIVAALSKPEFLGLVVFFLVSRRVPKIWRPVILAVMVIMISLFYSFVPLMEDLSAVLFRGQTAESLGVTVLLQQLATEYHLFGVVIIPRLLLAVYEGGSLYGSFFVAAMVVVLLRRRLRLADDTVFLLCLYLVMVSVVPFPHYRYVLPAYPLVLMLALQAKVRRVASVRVPLASMSSGVVG